MPKQHGTQRWLLGALVVLTLGLMALGSGQAASAEAKTTRPRPDFASREEFRLECAILGGTFTDDGRNIRCIHTDGTVIECDQNGQQCTVTNIGHQQPGGPNSPDGTGNQNEGDGGGTDYPGPGLPGKPLPDTLPNLPGND